VAFPAVDRGTLLTAIAPRIPLVVERSVSRAKAALSVYADVPEQELADGIVADLQRAMTALIEERPLTDADRAGMGAIGDARARQGIPLEAMLQVYRFTIDEVFNALWDAAEEGAVEHAQVVHLTRKIWQYADPMMDVAIQAYRARERELAVAEGQDRTALVHRLLLTVGGDELLDPVAIVGLDPEAEYVALRARSRGELRDLLLHLGTAGVLDGGAVAPHGTDVIGFARRRPTTAPPASIIGVGPAGPLRALPQSLAIATRVVDTASAYGRCGVSTLDEVALEAIARSETVIGAHLDARFLAPCDPTSPQGAELLGTVRALLEQELSIERAAEQLYVHPNTVRNRLRRFEQLTGASLRHIDDLVGLRLALLRTELRSPTPRQASATSALTSRGAAPPEDAGDDR
jgi:PucR C-terminal helix-turn-helix domain